MGNGAVLYRRMSTGVVLFSSLWLGFEALNPYSKAAPVVRVILLVVIVFLLVGVLPGSYLQRRIQAASQTEAVRRSRLLRIFATVFSFLGAAMFALVAWSEYSTLSFIDNSYLSGLDRDEVVFNIIRYWALSGASLVWWFLLIAAALMRKKTGDPQGP